MPQVSRLSALPLVCLALLSGCSVWRPATGPQSAAAPKPAAGTSPAPAAASAAAPAAATAAPTAAPPAGASASAAANAGLTPFDQVVKGADVQAGLMPLWRKGDKVWLELKPDMLGKPLFLSPKLATGIGEAGVFGGLMQSRFAQVGRPQWVEFRRVNQSIQLVAINGTYVADAGSPQARAVKSAYSPSLLSAVPLASAPHTTSGSVLIEAAPLLLGDWLGLAQHLQRSYRQSYALDGRNSSVQTARTAKGSVVFELLQHFGTGGIAAGSNTPGTPPSSVPLTQPDPRSLFVTLHLTLTPLPTQPMARRPADPRVGYFTSSVVDFSQEGPRSPRQRFINRWRLSKQDPKAERSPPVQPIVFWLDPSIPLAYRDAVTRGVLAWNRAFEAIGYTQAIEVRTPPEGQAFDTLETGHASIRWMTNSQPAFGAIGPSHVDPRTGEILDAQIALESLSSRAIRTARAQILGLKTSPTSSEADAPSPGLHDASCQHGEHAFEQLQGGLHWLAAQAYDTPPLDPDAPEVQAWVEAYIQDTTMHEVGHALGLRHNFRASRWRTPEQLQDLTLTTRDGNSASVMDYSALNLPLPGQRGGAPFQTTLGPYDFWAIAYGYGDLSDDPQAARAQLQQLLARAASPEEADALAYGTDEDNALGLDPEVITFDLGRDPVAFARQRIAIVQDLIQRQAHSATGPLPDPSLPRRTVGYALRELARTGQTLVRQLGGVVTRRAAAYQGADALAPLPAAPQRAALDVLLGTFLNPEAIGMPPSLLRRLAPDYAERADNGEGQFAGVDFSWTEQLLALQRPVLDALSNDALAERLQDNIDKSRDREPHPLTARELNKRVFEAIWQRGAAQDGLQPAWRNLQREHVNRLAVAVVRGGSRADVRALWRQQAQRVLKHLREAKEGGPDSTAEAHRLDCIQTLTAALQASVVRNTP